MEKDWRNTNYLWPLLDKQPLIPHVPLLNHISLHLQDIASHQYLYRISSDPPFVPSPFFCFLAHSLFSWSVFILFKSGFFYKTYPATFTSIFTSLFSLLRLCLYILFSPIIFPFSVLFLQSKTDQDSRLKCFPLFCAVQCRSNRRHSHVGNLMLGKLLFFSPTRCYSCKWAVLNFACVVECNNSCVGKVHWWYIFFFFLDVCLYLILVFHCMLSSGHQKPNIQIK